MTKSLKEAHKDFQDSGTSVKIGRSKFASLRPKYVKVKSKQPMNQCLCEYCLNVELKIKAVGTKVGFSTKFDVLNATLCERSVGNRYHKPECINRTCSLCGSGMLRRQLTDNLTSRDITWHEWGDDPNSNSKKLNIVTDSTSTFIQKFCSEVDFLAKHIFTAQWQADQYKYISSTVPDHWVVSVLDFAKNCV